MTSENHDMIIKDFSADGAGKELCRIKADGTIIWVEDLPAGDRAQGELLLKGYGITEEQIKKGSIA